MTRVWTAERISDALALSWNDFTKKYPGVSNYNGWKGARNVGRAQQALDDSSEPYLGEISDNSSPIMQRLLEEDAYEQGMAFNGIQNTYEPPSTATPDDRPAYEVRANGDIFINRASRTVVTYVGPEYGSVTMSFDQHAAMRRRYAHEWENDRETIPTIARDFDLHPRAFTRYKTLHGWTHDSDPFTDEEWQEGLTPEEAVTQTVESHRRAFHKKLQKEKWTSLIKDAESWRRFDESVLTPIQAAIATCTPSNIAPMQWPPQSPRRPYDLVLCPSDLHYGKHGWTDETGREYSRETARALLLEKTDQLLQMVARFGPPAKIITAIGSDWFHIDNDQGATTAGTPQDLDGTPHQIIREGIELAVEQLSLLRWVAPLEIYYMGGNHDRVLGYALLCTVKAWFRDDIHVEVHESAHPRQYHRNQHTLIGFTHGDGAKLADLPMIMATEVPYEWGQTRNHIWFTGHLHHEVTKDTFGVMTYQLSSLSGNDRWHAQKGYGNARRSMSAYVVDHEYGVTATLTAPVNDEPTLLMER